jgi:hypothetical protein
VNDLETMMRELVKSSVLLKHKLYRRDDFSSTSPEGTEGPHISVHACRLCNRAAAGNGAQVRHKSDCPLARLQRAQRALHGAWPELFTSKPAQAAPAPSTATAPVLASASASVPGISSACAHLGGGVAPVERAYDMHAWPDSAPQSSRRKGRPRASSR